MNHNVDLHIQGIQYACAMQDLPQSQRKDFISSDLIDFAGGLCEEILTSEKPMELIDRHRRLLTRITGVEADNHVHMDIGDIMENE